MSDFHQQGVIADLHRLHETLDSESYLLGLEGELEEYARKVRMALVLPVHISEFRGGKALPKIVAEISKVRYLHQILIALGGVERLRDFQAAKDYIGRLRAAAGDVKFIWVDGPRIQSVFRSLQDQKMSIGASGKGQSVRMRPSIVSFTTGLRRKAPCDVSRSFCRMVGEKMPELSKLPSSPPGKKSPQQTPTSKTNWSRRSRKTTYYHGIFENDRTSSQPQTTKTPSISLMGRSKREERIMEVRETAACGISKREFAIEFEGDELVNVYRVMHYAQKGIGFYDEGFLEDLLSQMSFIIGPAVFEPKEENSRENSIRWEDTGIGYVVFFNETEAGNLFQIFNGAKTPGEGFNRELNQKLLNQMLEIAPTHLQNLPIINR